MIKINLDKAKNITHELRRAARSHEFEPYDAVIMKQIPGNDFIAAESARQEIRQRYAGIQQAIDACADVEHLTHIHSELQRNLGN